MKWHRKKGRWATFCCRLCVLQHAKPAWRESLKLRHRKFYDRLLQDALGHPLQLEQVVTAEQIKALVQGAYKQGAQTTWKRYQAGRDVRKSA